MRRSRLALTLIVFGWGLLAAIPAPAQIVNTLEGFDAKQPGWSGAIGGSLRSTGGNSEVFDVAADARLQRLSDRQRWRALFGYSFSSADGVDEAEELFTHLRHNHRLVGHVHSLAFVQLQQNPFQRLRSRVLVGAGARLDLVRGERAALSWGLAHMVERESLRGIEGELTVQRLSSFVDFRVPLSENAALSLTAFVQPRWADFGDLRATASVQVEAKIAGPVSLVGTAQVAHDSEPPVEVEETDWTIRTGIRVRT